MDLPQISKVRQAPSYRELRKSLERTLAAEIAGKIFRQEEGGGVRDKEVEKPRPRVPASSASASLREQTIELLNQRAAALEGTLSLREPEINFRMMVALQNRCFSIFGSSLGPLSTNVPFACLSCLFRHRQDGERSSLSRHQNGSRDLYDGIKMAIVGELEKLRIRPEVAGPQVDKFALAYTFNVSPSLFDDDSLFRFCRTRIANDNVKPVQVMIQRIWRSKSETSASPPGLETAFAMMRYDATKICMSLSDRECRLALDLFPKVAIA